MHLEQAGFMVRHISAHRANDAAIVDDAPEVRRVSLTSMPLRPQRSKRSGEGMKQLPLFFL